MPHNRGKGRCPEEVIAKLQPEGKLRVLNGKLGHSFWSRGNTKSKDPEDRGAGYNQGATGSCHGTELCMTGKRAQKGGK